MDLHGCCDVWFNGNILWEFSRISPHFVKVKWFGSHGMGFNDKLNVFILESDN